MAPAPAIRLGLIGAGRWGRNYIRTINELPGTRLVRLASTNPRSRDFVDDGCLISSDWNDVAGADDVDGVVIAAPPGPQPEIAETAVRAGNPVLLEKPMALELGVATRLQALVVKHGVLAMVDHTHVYSACFQEILKRVNQLGPILRVRSRAGNFGPFRADASVLWDWGAHDVAMVLRLLGRLPTRIGARSVERRETDGQAGETLIIDLTFDDLEAEIEVSNIRDRKQRLFEVFFDTGAVVYDDVGDVPLAFYRCDGGAVDWSAGEAISVDGTLPLSRVVSMFAAAIANGEADHESLQLGVDVVSVLSECDRKLRNRRAGVSST